MILSFCLAIFAPLTESNTSFQDLFLLLSSAIAGGAYLSRKELHQLKRRAKWQLTKATLRSFFKKEKNQYLSNNAAWIVTAAIFLLLGLWINFLVAALIVVGAWIVYAIIANSGPSY